MNSPARLETLIQGFPMIWNTRNSAHRINRSIWTRHGRKLKWDGSLSWKKKKKTQCPLILPSEHCRRFFWRFQTFQAWTGSSSVVVREEHDNDTLSVPGNGTQRCQAMLGGSLKNRFGIFTSYRWKCAFCWKYQHTHGRLPTCPPFCPSSFAEEDQSVHVRHNEDQTKLWCLTKSALAGWLIVLATMCFVLGTAEED